MKSILKIFLMILLLIIPALVVNAQDITLKGRSAIELNFGLWGGSKVSNTISGSGVQTEAKSSSLLGSIGYTYGLREYLLLTVTAGLLSANVSTSVNIFNVTEEVSTVVPLLLGVRFYIPDPGPGENIRPFISAAVGTYIGSEAKNTVLSQEARSESAFGGRLGAGIDFLLGNHFKLNAQAGYNLMSDFTNTIGTRKNYNGADFSLGVGYIF